MIPESPPCLYPECKHKLEMHFNMEIRNGNSKTFIKDEDIGFCTYHFFLVAAGGFYVAKWKDTDAVELIGPTKEIAMIERVLGAIEMTKTNLKKKEVK